MWTRWEKNFVFSDLRNRSAFDFTRECDGVSLRIVCKNMGAKHPTGSRGRHDTLTIRPYECKVSV